MISQSRMPKYSNAADLDSAYASHRMQTTFADLAAQMKDTPASIDIYERGEAQYRASAQVDPQRYTGPSQGPRHALKLRDLVGAFCSTTEALNLRGTDTRLTDAKLKSIPRHLNGAVAQHMPAVVRALAEKINGDISVQWFHTAALHMNAFTFAAAKTETVIASNLEAERDRLLFGAGAIDRLLMAYAALVWDLFEDANETEYKSLVEAEWLRFLAACKSYQEHRAQLARLHVWVAERGEILLWGEANGGIDRRLRPYYFKATWDRYLKQPSTRQ